MTQHPMARAPVVEHDGRATCGECGQPCTVTDPFPDPDLPPTCLVFVDCPACGAWAVRLADVAPHA